MKLHDLFESAAPNFGALQKAIYALVIGALRGDADTISDAKGIASQTDDFWVESFDTAFKSLSKGEELSLMSDDISQACSDVGEAIVDYFSNKNNFAPGETPGKVTFHETGITSEQVLSLIDRLCPGLVKKLSDSAAVEAAANKVAAKKASAEEKKSITPEIIAGVAKFMKKHDAKCWAAFFSVITADRKQGRADRAKSDFFPKGTTQKAFDAIDSAAALKEFFKSKSAQEYIQTMYDNLTNLKDMPDAALVSHLYIISKDKAFSTALMGML